MSDSTQKTAEEIKTLLQLQKQIRGGTPLTSEVVNIIRDRELEEIKRLNNLIIHVASMTTELLEKNKRYREALEFYADENTWISPKQESLLPEDEPLPTWAEQDWGHKARAALSPAEPVEKKK